MIDALENIKILLYDATSNVSYISISPLLLPDEEIRVHIDTSYIIESEAHSLIRKMKLSNYFGDIHE